MVFMVNVLFLFSLFSCATMPPQTSPDTGKINFQAETNDAVDELLNNCIIKLDPERPIIVASLVSIDDIQKSSTFGRMSSEIIASRLSQVGYSVKELKMSQNQIYIKKAEGEFVLSRDIQNVATRNNVQAIVVGTYAINKVGSRHINICLKVVDPVSNIIGCSQCYLSKSHEYNWE